MLMKTKRYSFTKELYDYPIVHRKKLKSNIMTKSQYQYRLGTETIDMCLVHSDNYMLSKPSLNTFLHVKAWKSGRPSSPIHPDNRDEQDKKTNVKFYRWTFGTKSMQATWDFHIIPAPTQFIDIANSQKTFVRYGCVILLSSLARRFRPLTDDVWAEMNRWK